jgi:molybdopterin/thiamine biosynthesis adenylyltransferase
MVDMHARLCDHLFPGNGKEAAGLLVCTRVPGSRIRLLARDLLTIPHEECVQRTAHSITWPGKHIELAIDKATTEDLAIILVHSHPTGYPNFSDSDDASDQSVMPCLFEALGEIHGSAVMLPGGVMFARLYGKDGTLTPVDLVSLVGDDLHFWWRDDLVSARRRPMAFTSAMSCELSRLTVCIIGISGTGSIVAEQVCRLGFGRVVGIDHDHVEEKNLNRILNAVKRDAEEKRAKVSSFSERVNQYRSAPYFLGIEANLLSREAVIEAAQADVIFCCVDTHKARMLADRIAAAFLLPLFDVGVGIPTRRNGEDFAIAEINGRIDYVRPGGSSLEDRGIYTPATLQAEDLAESDPQAYLTQVKAGYIDGVPEQAPSVITLNMRAASACVMEFIARAYPYRHEPNHRFARTKFMLAEGFEEYTPEAAFNAKSMPILAQGGHEPLLGLPILGGIPI